MIRILAIILMSAAILRADALPPEHVHHWEPAGHVIPAGETATLDADVEYAGLVVRGRLVVPAGRTLTFSHIAIRGEGAVEFAGTLRHKPSPFAEDDAEKQGNGITIMDSGRLVGRGEDKTAWTTLAHGARTGDAKLFLAAEPVGWEPGDRLIVVGTRGVVGRLDYYRPESEVHSLAGLDGVVATLAAPLAWPHPEAVGTKTGVRVPVAIGNLSRSAAIVGTPGTPADRRCHIMAMDRGLIDLVGVRLDIGRSRLFPEPQSESRPFWTRDSGRYPIHWHDATIGQPLDDGSHGRVVGCVFETPDTGTLVDRPMWPIVMHGSHHMRAADNVVVGYGGAGIVASENGDEWGNIVEGNLIVGIVGTGGIYGQGEPMDRGARYQWRVGGHGVIFNGKGTVTGNYCAEVGPTGSTSIAYNLFNVYVSRDKWLRPAKPGEPATVEYNGWIEFPGTYRDNVSIRCGAGEGYWDLGVNDKQADAPQLDMRWVRFGPNTHANVTGASVRLYHLHMVDVQVRVVGYDNPAATKSVGGGNVTALNVVQSFRLSDSTFERTPSVFAPAAILRGYKGEEGRVVLDVGELEMVRCRAVDTRSVVYWAIKGGNAGVPEITPPLWPRTIRVRDLRAEGVGRLVTTGIPGRVRDWATPDRLYWHDGDAVRQVYSPEQMPGWTYPASGAIDHKGPAGPRGEPCPADAVEMPGSPGFRWR